MAWRNRCTPIPDSGIPNSEFRMAYGESRIPHHEVLGLGGSDIRCPMGDPGGLVLNPEPGLWVKEGGNHTLGTDPREPRH
jgi:hypothetical protein